MNILLVDTTPLYRDILQQSFGRCRGVVLSMASEINEAMTMAASREFDFFVLAGQLSDGSGIELAKRLRASGRAPVAPIVLLTASPSAELARQASLAGVTELFRKQDVEELITFMRHFLDANQPLHSRVLYIEDAKDQRELMERQLAEWGMTVDAFANADDAWEAFLHSDYDLVLSDIHLGGHMSGARLINRIRRQSMPRGGIPILAITAYDNPAGRIELFHLGIDDYVLKPVLPVELRARLQNLLMHKRANERSQHLLEATALGVTVIDEEGYVLSMDANARSLFGVAETTVDANSIRTLLGDAAEEILALIIAGSAKSRQKMTIRAAAGKEIPVELSTLELEAANGWRQFALLIRDISQEQELADTLRRAKDAAEHANRVKAEFLANMSHEIRTPLSAIIGMAHLMKKNGLSPDQAERLAHIDNSGRHLLGIINDVLDFSKIEAGKLGLECIPVSIGTIASNVASMVYEKATAKGIKLQVETEPMPAHVAGDPTRLTQALLNFASNAVKFTEAGSITIRTRKLSDNADGVMVHFEVADTGIGISPSAQENIFASFHQADNSTTRKFGGTGLGLAITRQLARLMGGDAGVRSAPGEGSCFWFSARLSHLNLPSEAVDKRPAHYAEDVLVRDFAGVHILLVEDDYINREVALEMLSCLGLVIDLAEDGLEALDLVRKQDYALILMDMQMPRMDGLEATRQIRGLLGGKHLPIIAMTANAFAEDRQRCLEAGMDDFVAKPIDPELLYETLLHWLLITNCTQSAVQPM